MNMKIIWVVPSLPDSASSTGAVVEIDFIDEKIDGSITGEDVSSVVSVVYLKVKSDVKIAIKVIH